MKKKFFITIGVIVTILVHSLLVFAVYTLFDMQYNMATGVSSRINITMTKDEGKKSVYYYEGYKIKIEGKMC